MIEDGRRRKMIEGLVEERAGRRWSRVVKGVARDVW